MATTLPLHQPGVEYNIEHAYRGTCACGWLGRWTSPEQAERDAREHEQATA